MKNLKIVKMVAVLLCALVAMLNAKAKENQCFFPAYYKEAKFCKTITVYDENDEAYTTLDEKKCEQAKQESGYSDFVKNFVAPINLGDLSKYVVEGFYDFDERGDFFDMNGNPIPKTWYYWSVSPFAFKYEKELREATDCKGKSCTTQAYNDKGNLIYEANCIAGVNHGKQTLYKDTGELLMELNYNNGKLEGKQKLPRTANFNNDIINEVEIKNGKLSGKLEIAGTDSYSADEGDSFNLKGEFKNGKPISKVLISNDEYGDYRGKGITTGELEIPFDKNSNVNEEVIGFYSTRHYQMPPRTRLEIINVKDNKPISFKIIRGLPEEWGTNAKDIEPFFKNLEDSIKKQQIPEEYTSLDYSGGSCNDSKQKMGKWIEKNISYDTYDTYNDNKNIVLKIIESNYTNDKLNGMQKEWINGQLRREANYKNDVIDGTLKEWDTNGNLIKAEIYKDGQRVQIIR